MTDGSAPAQPLQLLSRRPVALCPLSLPMHSHQLSHPAEEIKIVHSRCLEAGFECFVSCGWGCGVPAELLLEWVESLRVVGPWAPTHCGCDLACIRVWLCPSGKWGGGARFLLNFHPMLLRGRGS